MSTDSSTLDNEISKLVNKKIEEDLVSIRQTAESTLKGRMEALETRLERQLKGRLVTIAVAIVSLAALALVSGMYTVRNQINDSVISLQKDVISAQSVIRDSTKELQEMESKTLEAQSKLKVVTDELNTKKAEYESLVNAARTQPRR